MSKSEIFTKAWTLAKAGAVRFGGSSKDFFAASLKIVYAQSRIFVLDVNSSRNKPAWCAQVTGLDKKFGFKREFVSGNGRWELADGIYNWGYKGDNREFLLVKNGEAQVIYDDDVKLMFA
jgi:hypothetical protein